MKQTLVTNTTHRQNLTKYYFHRLLVDLKKWKLTISAFFDSLKRQYMEYSNDISNARLESNSKIGAYFEHAGALGHIVVMIAFYIIVFTGLIIVL